MEKLKIKQAIMALTNDSYYPPVEASALQVWEIVFESMRNDPLWLERNDCPYDDDLRKELAGFWVRMRPGGRETVAAAVTTGDDLESNLITIYNELVEFKGSIGDGDIKEKMSYYRTVTSLLDKLTGLSERTKNVKAVSAYTAAVHRVFEEVMTPEQRTRAMEMLGDMT